MRPKQHVSLFGDHERHVVAVGVGFGKYMDADAVVRTPHYYETRKSGTNHAKYIVLEHGSIVIPDGDSLEDEIYGSSFEG